MWVYIPYGDNKFERRYYPEGQDINEVCAMNGWASEVSADAHVTSQDGSVFQVGKVVKEVQDAQDVTQTETANTRAPAKAKARKEVS